MRNIVKCGHVKHDYLNRLAMERYRLDTVMAGTARFIASPDGAPARRANRRFRARG
jgi:hypothetical protein